MTNLMISRNNWLEAKRHDSATEAEAARHNAEMERLQGEANAETARSHRESEAISRENLAESRRHSVATESISAATVAETTRTNLVREAETLRHNQKVENLESRVARMTNSREWEKLNQNQQRIEAQNALDTAKTFGQQVENLINKRYAELDKAGVDVAKMRADVAAALAGIRVTQQKFDWQKQVDSRNLTMAEQKTASDIRKNTAQEAESYTRAFKNVLDTFKNAVTMIAGA